MLVITRKVGETVTVKLNEEVSITVVGVDYNTVKLGFDAPREVEIIREDAVIKHQQK